MAEVRPRGWWYPWLFVGGMLLVVAVNVVLAAVAITTFPGLTSEDAYRQGLQYNRTIAAAEAQEARGWRLDLTITPQPAAHGGLDTPADVALSARFSDRSGQPLSRLDVRAVLVRPLGGGDDLALPLEETGGGVYRGTLTPPLGGQWDVHIHARRGDETFQQTRRIVLR
jgi:nitrogen fixation protein FixH